MDWALAMACGHCVVLLLLMAAAPGLGQRSHPKPGLQHSYDCGIKGMQLLVFPRPGQTVRFKVVDEFGNRFEANNCSICYHWVTSQPQEPAVLSAGYKGCHVLEKDGRWHLRVFMEAELPDGRVDAVQETTLICPKPRAAHAGTLDTQLTPTTTVSDPASPGLGPVSPDPLLVEQSPVHPTPASPALGLEPTLPTSTPLQRVTSEYQEVDQADTIGTHLTRAQCQVASGHIPCTVKRNSKEACERAGCCYDHTREVPCYYGNTATVQCFRNGYFILVVSKETALTHRITLAHIRLAYTRSGCPPVQKTSAFMVFHFPFTRCGTTVQVVGNQLIYENQLVSDTDVQQGPQGSITRDGTFRLHVRCIFNASDFLPVQASIFPAPSPASVTQSGPLRLELRIAKDKTFSSYYGEGDYPITRLLREPVHVEVRLLQRTDPNLVLKLHQCWATPSTNPFQQPQWSLLSDGCPFKGDSYRTQMVALDRAVLPFSSHYQRFTVATFTLLDSSSQRALRGPVYFFCSASVCYRSGLETCSTMCSPGTARQRRSSGYHNDTARSQDIVSSPGPVGFEDSYTQEPTLGPKGSSRNSSPRPLLWAILLLLAAVLVLAVGVFISLSQAWAQKPRKGDTVNGLNKALF
ncbi:zona pellucida sperm-binding protein 1 [Tupaia chinensis]|uniref:Zona pellucida sperm-binding protein 1 n=1 Tax=Tupaia chinensis TaxID=246437 RepID=L8Y1K8_TUPCH|nr:zona pellucida sperm-binding protein 1 [Tupaia chinensis]ELV10238.1 Zona pellucida sperm-binding protein 1 [Tupaia chinensis]